MGVRLTGSGARVSGEPSATGGICAGSPARPAPPRQHPLVLRPARRPLDSSRPARGSARKPRALARKPAPAAPPRPAGWRGCSPTWPGRAGRRRGWPRPAPGTGRRPPGRRPAPSARRPASARPMARLFTDMARLGR